MGVANNRRGEPEARLVLTERELRLGHTEKENTGMWLRLDASDLERWGGAGPGWFDQKKLEEIGFDCRVAPSDPSAERFYGKALPKRRYVALELEGDAWKSFMARREEELLNPPPGGAYVSQTPEQRRKVLEDERAFRSRLFVVDVGRDPADLRRRHPDRSRFIVTEAVVRLQLDRTWDESTKSWKNTHLRGYVSEILTSEIHVPLGRRRVLDAIKDERARSEGSEAYLQGPPRYQVTLSYGRRLEPWIDDVRPLEAQAPPGR